MKVKSRLHLFTAEGRSRLPTGETQLLASWECVLDTKKCCLVTPLLNEMETFKKRTLHEEWCGQICKFFPSCLFYNDKVPAKAPFAEALQAARRQQKGCWQIAPFDPKKDLFSFNLVKLIKRFIWFILHVRTFLRTFLEVYSCANDYLRTNQSYIWAHLDNMSMMLLRRGNPWWQWYHPDQTRPSLELPATFAWYIRDQSLAKMDLRYGPILGPDLSGLTSRSSRSS